VKGEENEENHLLVPKEMLDFCTIILVWVGCGEH